MAYEFLAPQGSSLPFFPRALMTLSWHLNPRTIGYHNNESHHRLRCWSVTGMLRRAAPNSMKKVERRRDARKPGRNKIWSEKKRKKWDTGRQQCTNRRLLGPCSWELWSSGGHFATSWWFTSLLFDWNVWNGFLNEVHRWFLAITGLFCLFVCLFCLAFFFFKCFVFPYLFLPKKFSKSSEQHSSGFLRVPIFQLVVLFFCQG